MSKRSLAALGAAVLVCACSGSEQKTLPMTDARVNALFNHPGLVQLSSDGSILNVVDTGNQVVRQITMDGTTATIGVAR